MSKKVLRTALKTVLPLFVLIILICFPRKNDTFADKKDEKVKSVVLRPWYFKGGSLRPQPLAKRLKLWPEEANSDRIINQLMFIPEEKPRLKKKIFLFGSKLQNIKFQNGSEVFRDCPVENCEIVYNKVIADAVVFEDSVKTVRKKSFKQQIWVLHSLESPLISGVALQQKSVNWTASYRHDSDLVTPYDKWVYYDENRKGVKLQRNFAAGKRKKVAWFVSNCKSKNKRFEYAKALRQYISVDIYGVCGEKVCLKQFDNSCRKIVSKEYKFYLSFENANCRDYITEKFYTYALRLNVIPIVMGAPKEDYEKVAPHKSFIHVEDFPSPKHLADYLHYLDKNDEEYNSYFLWKGAGEFINTYFMCRLCAMLHAHRNPHFYQRITRWWRGPNICTKTFWNNATKDKILTSLSNIRILK